MSARESDVELKGSWGPSSPVEVGPLSESPERGARIPDVVLRVLPDTRVVEFQVTQSSAPPPPSSDEELVGLSEQLEQLSVVLQSSGKRPDVDVGPDCARSVEPKPVSELLPEVGAREVEKWVALAFKRSARTAGTYRLEDDDGISRTFQVTVMPGDSDGVVVIKDISVTAGLDVVEQALERGDLQLRLVLRVGPQGQVIAGCGEAFHAAWEEDAEPLTAIEGLGPLRAELDQWLVHAAIRHLAGSATAGFPLPVAVEVSQIWLQTRGAVATLTGLLSTYGASAELLELRAPFSAWFGKGVHRLAHEVRTPAARWW